MLKRAQETLKFSDWWLVAIVAGGFLLFTSVGIAVAIFLTWVIPPMPLYSELYKTANHEGDIFLHASAAAMIVSFVILAMVGMVSGFFPALKAARMDPVEALRYE